MCLPCASNKMRVWSFMENRMTGYPIKFDQNQVQQLKKKFKKISGNREVIDKVSFQQNMGILGLTSVQGFSDRLFNSFDTDTDGKISFQDFVQYMEVLKSGNEKNKARISYRLIDIRNKNSVNVKEFKEFLDDYFRSWTSITNSLVTPEIKQKTDDYVDNLYKKVKKQTGKDYIDFGYYAEKVFSDQEFLDAFEFITQGVANMFISGPKVGQDTTILYKVLKTIRQIHTALNNSSDARTSGVSDYEKLGGNSNLYKTDFLKNKPSILGEEIPQTPQTPSKNHFFNLNIPSSGMPNYKNTSQTGFTNTTILTSNQNKTIGNQTYHLNETQQQPQSHHQCKNCLKVEVLERKLQYLTSKIKKLVEDTQRIYERLDEKLYDQTSQKKNQTVGNIHVQQRPMQGNMIFIGDDNWNLVLNMMIGIQMAVRSVRGYQEMIYQQPRDFNLKYYFELVPRRFGDHTALSRICSFTDYAPNTFNHIRKIFNIHNEEYINSIGPNKLMTSLMMGEVNSLTGLTSQGKSGSFFYYTADGKYMLKTIQYREYKKLRGILQDYYYYIKQNPHTLITKFFGLHKLIEKDGEGEIIGKSYFVIMANVFNTKQKITERYDIKGSSYGRQTKSQHPNATKKDNDFKNSRKPICIDSKSRQQLMRTIRKDAQFFRAHDIIDYSLLIGVIKKDLALARDGSQVIRDRQSKKQSPEKGQLRSRETLEYEGNDLRQSHMYQNINNQEEYILGIIDILTEYSTRKVAQYYFKSLIYGKGVSAIPPDDYSHRFVNFIDNFIFKKYDSPLAIMSNSEQKKVNKRNSKTAEKYQNDQEIELEKQERKNKVFTSKDSVVSSYHFRSRESMENNK